MSYKFIKKNDYSNTNVELSIDTTSVTLDELVSTFESFLRACGFNIGNDERLDFISDLNDYDDDDDDDFEKDLIGDLEDDLEDEEDLEDLEDEDVNTSKCNCFMCRAQRDSMDPPPPPSSESQENDVKEDFSSSSLEDILDMLIASAGTIESDEEAKAKAVKEAKAKAVEEATKELLSMFGPTTTNKVTDMLSIAEFNAELEKLIAELKKQ